MEDKEQLVEDIQQTEKLIAAEADGLEAECCQEEKHTQVHDRTSENMDCLKQMNAKLENIAETEQRLFSEVREIHKLYHTEFAGRLRTMQDELDQYHEIDKGRVYDDILAALARIYNNNENLDEETEEPKVKKSIKYMLMDIEELLGMYGMLKLRSMPGEKRNTRHCQVVKRISTSDPAKHDTIAKSYNSGFYIGNRTVIKELVDIFIYEKMSGKETEKKQNMEMEKTLVSE